MFILIKFRTFPLSFLVLLCLLFSYSASASITPIALAPVDTISKTSPRFYWTKTPGVERYAIRVWSSGSVIFDEITLEGLSCDTNSCSFRKSDASFPNGSYTWRVKPYFPNGQSGSWSKSQSFVVDTTGDSSSSGTVTQIAPSSVINESVPTFVWSPVENISKYVIKILDAQGNVAFSGLTPNNFSCSETLCAYSRQTWSLADGNASWQIRTEADDGTNGTWSDPVEFSVDTFQSQIPEQLYPTVDTASSTPQFLWKAVDGYNKYAIRLRDNNRSVVLSKVTPNNFNCPEGVCSYTAEGVSFSGNGSWQIRTEAADGTDGPWSDYLSFRVVVSRPIHQPKTISPTNFIGETTPTFKWGTSYLEAYKYAVRVLDSSGAVIFNSITPSNLDCTGGICSYVKQGVILPENEILSWTIRTEAANGTNGSWSAPRYFQIGGTNKAPTAVISLDKNTYKRSDKVTLSGELSIDPEETLLTYSWRMVNTPANSFNHNISGRYKREAFFYAGSLGTYTVSLTVSDGLKSSTTLSYIKIEFTDNSTVAKPPQINSFSTNVSSIQQGESVQFEMHVIDDNNDQVTCYLDFNGDNKAIRRIDDCGNKIRRINHTYTDAGLYAPRLIVTDGNHNPVVATPIVAGSSAGIITVDGSILITRSEPRQLSSSIPEISFLFDAISDNEIQSAKVRILDSRIIDTEVILDFADPRIIKGSFMVGEILTTGNYIAEFIVEDNFGAKAVAYKTFYFEQTLELISNLPNSGTVVNAPMKLDATCIFDVGDCQINVLIDTSPVIQFTATNQLPPTEIDLSSYESGSYTISITAAIQTQFWDDQEVTHSSTIYLENSDKLALVDSVPGRILDANESKILYLLPKETVGDNLYIYDRLGKTTTTIELPEDDEVDLDRRSYLTPTGAFFKTSGYKEWHQSNGLIDYSEIFTEPKLSGDYAVWTSQDKGLWLREFSSDSFTQIGLIHPLFGSINSKDYHVASNGIIAYLSLGDLLEYNVNTGDTDTLIVGDSSFRFELVSVLTDGSSFVYEVNDAYGPSGYSDLKHFDGVTVSSIGTLNYEYGANHSFNNGKVVYQSGLNNIWVWDALNGNDRRTYWGQSMTYPITFETLGDNGDVMLRRRNTATGRYERYLSADSDDPHPTSIHVNQIDSRSLQINGIWYVIIGNSLFQVKRPPVAVTTQVPMYLTADQGGLWDTTESVSRIATVFTEEEIETTFITLNDILHAYKDWTDVDAPYSSAHTRDSYSEYVLELEYKWGPKKFNPRLTKPKDAGIIFHVYGPTNEPWPSGLEYQLKEPDQYGGFVSVRTRAKVTHTNGIYDEAAVPVQVGREVGTEHIDVDIAGPISPDWNTVRLEVSGDSGVYYFNGEKVMEFTDAEYFDHNKQLWLPLTHGRIILQAEGAEIEYRNVTLSPLIP